MKQIFQKGIIRETYILFFFQCGTPDFITVITNNFQGKEYSPVN